MLGAPYTDIRIERRVSWQAIEALPGLVSIDLQPPASGPEIELTFGTAEGADPAEESFLCAEAERATGCSVLASRRRTYGPSGQSSTAALERALAANDRAGEPDVNVESRSTGPDDLVAPSGLKIAASLGYGPEEINAIAMTFFEHVCGKKGDIVEVFKSREATALGIGLL